MKHAPSPACLETLAWIVDAGLDGRSERGLTEGLAARLLAAGLPVDRFSVGSEVLDPIVQSRSYVWTKDGGTEKFRFERQLERSDDWRRSILHWMENNGVDRAHLRLDSERAQPYPLLQRLRAEGYHDYYVRQIGYGRNAQLGGSKGVWVAFATRDEAGFSPAHIGTIEMVTPAFALAFLSQSKTRMFTRVLSTYLGDRPAQSVLRGQIARGETQTIEAAVWMSDIAGYTEAADQMRREGILEFLNVYAEIVTDAVYAHGGEVLKFIGDGVLAVFDKASDGRPPAERALDAAIAVRQAVALARQQREADGRHAAEIVVALHHGRVLFGNFGSPDRLDFTALGSTVNEASRLVTLAKTLEQHLIVSDAFRDELRERRKDMVSLGRYVLRSVSGAHHLYTMDPHQLAEISARSLPPVTGG